MLKIGEIKEHHKPGKLLLDFDSKKRPSKIVLESLLMLCDLKPVSFRFERSTNRGWHVIIQLASKLSKMQTVAVQAILGSDPKREAMNYQRATSGVTSQFWATRFNILFAAKGTAILGQPNSHRAKSRKEKRNG